MILSVQRSPAILFVDSFDSFCYLFFTAIRWKGSLYPLGCTLGAIRSFYAEHFDSVEVDPTFYACPSVHTISGWFRKTPDNSPVKILLPFIRNNCRLTQSVYLDRRQRPLGTLCLSPDLHRVLKFRHQRMAPSFISRRPQFGWTRNWMTLGHAFYRSSGFICGRHTLADIDDDLVGGLRNAFSQRTR